MCKTAAVVAATWREPAALPLVAVVVGIAVAVAVAGAAVGGGDAASPPADCWSGCDSYHSGRLGFLILHNDA